MLKEMLMGVMSQEEVLFNYNATLLYRNLPREVYGYVFCYRGINCIVINERLSTIKKKKTILHELAHIELNHLGQRDKDLFEFYIEGYEDEAEKYVNKIINQEGI